MTIINPAKIYSTLGNPNSLIPLAVKDSAATAGMTAGSYFTGKEEGEDRFIDEIGTEFIWLGGLPFFKWGFDNTVFRALGLDSKFDARNFNNKDVFEKTQEYAPRETIKNNIKKIAKKERLFKNTVSTKFVVSTALTVASYMGLTKFKQKYTEKKIRENLIAEYSAKKAHEAKEEKSLEINNKESKKPSFKGVGPMVEKFAFSPVRNMWILDGFITEERLRESRSPQEFIGYAIKEASTLIFMYYAGDKIQAFLEKRAKEKYNKTIGLDARVLEDSYLKKAFEDGSIKKSLEEFRLANTSDVKLYEFLHKNPDNLIVKTAKQSDIISLVKDTEMIDTRKYIDLEDIKGINTKLEELYKQYQAALEKGDTSEKFFNGVKKLKRHSILTNIGTCIFALGVATPAIMLAKRLSGNDNKEFQTKKEIREQLIREGVIS